MVRMQKKLSEKYTALDNTVAKDNRLHWKTRGIFLYLWSLPSDWEFYVSEVAKHAPDGEEALRTGLKELEQFGYLKRINRTDEAGKIVGLKWILSDVPMNRHGGFTDDGKNRRPGNTDDGKSRRPENRTLQKKNNTKEKLNTKEKDNKLSAREIEEDFEKLWKLYPNKKGKKNALAAYKRAIKKGVSNKEIQDGIIKYKKQIEIQGTEPRFIAQGSTWFNQERWNDEYDTKSVPVRRNSYGAPHIEEKIPDWDTQKPKPQTQQNTDDIEELMAKVNQKTAANKDKVKEK